MRVTYIFPFDPLPADSGAAKRCLQLAGSLKRIGAGVRLLFATHKRREDMYATIHELQQQWVTTAEAYPISRMDYRLSHAAARGREVFGLAPAIVYHPFLSPALRAWFRTRMREDDADVVLTTYPWTDPLIPSRKVVPKMIDVVDLMTSYIKQLKRVTAAMVSSGDQITGFDARALDVDFVKGVAAPEAHEFSIYDRYQETICISRTEAAQVSAGSPGTRVTYLPQVPPPRLVANTYEASPLYLMRNNPFNFHGFFVFVERVLPLVLARVPEFVLQVVGNGCDRVASRPGVECVGYIADIESVYRTARFFVNPVLAGTGQSIKTAESMAFGLPVVAFEALAQDSPLVHGESGLVARTVEEFAGHTVQLWRSVDDCRRMGTRARQSIGEWCDQSLCDDLLDVALKRARGISD